MIHSSVWQTQTQLSNPPVLSAVLSGYLTENVTRMGEVGRGDSPAMPVHTDNKTVALAKDFTPLQMSAVSARKVQQQSWVWSENVQRVKNQHVVQVRRP